jgi:malate dehydrogenase
VSVAAILGAGPVGGAIALRLAERQRIAEIRLIDEQAQVAAGKALDIQQSGPIAGFDTRLSATGDVLAAAGADVIVVADDLTYGEWQGDRGLALVARLHRAGARAPIVFAGPSQTWLMETAARELHIEADRLIGTAASATPAIVSSLVAIDLEKTGAQVAISGRPPSFVVVWSSATIGGALITDRLPAHRLLAISQTLSRLWPPGPQAIAAPTAQVVDALLTGSRSLLSVCVITGDEFDARGRSALLPVSLGHGRVLARHLPTLSPQERTETVTSLARQDRS